MRVASAALMLILLTPLAAAPPAAAPPRAEEIVVTGARKPLTLSAKTLARAARAHRKGRPVYAPQSRLSFEVRSGPDRRSLQGLTLTFRSKDKVVPVVLDADHRFVLPELPGKGWKLVANRNVGVVPLVMSPGTSDADRMLGDLRLQCHVLWAMEKSELPIWARATAAAFGGLCTSPLLGYLEWSDRAIKTAFVTDGGLPRPLFVSSDRHAYRPPLYDKTLPHTARVRFRYE